MPPRKTYILPHNFDLHRGGPVQIGNIIADPFEPTKLLSIPILLPPTTTHIEYDRSFNKSSSYSVKSNIWATFLQFVGAKLGHNFSKDSDISYTMDKLEAIYMDPDPTDEEAAERIEHPAVKAQMNAALLGFGTKPVYMVTGLKIASGLKGSMGGGRSYGGEAGATVPITESVSAGGEASVSVDRKASETFRSEGDVIFAYRLHVIATKGYFRNRKISIDLHKPGKAGFLDRDDQGSIDDFTTGAAESASTGLLTEALEHEDKVSKVIVVQEGGEEVDCIFQGEAVS